MDGAGDEAARSRLCGADCGAAVFGPDEHEKSNESSFGSIMNFFAVSFVAPAGVESECDTAFAVAPPIRGLTPPATAPPLRGLLFGLLILKSNAAYTAAESQRATTGESREKESPHRATYDHCRRRTRPSDSAVSGDCPSEALIYPPPLRRRPYTAHTAHTHDVIARVPAKAVREGSKVSVRGGCRSDFFFGLDAVSETSASSAASALSAANAAASNLKSLSICTFEAAAQYRSHRVRNAQVSHHTRPEVTIRRVTAE